jgi:sugar lactone lactonase YvrE
MRRRALISALVALCFAAFAACDLNPTGIELAPGWQARSVVAWRPVRPDMLALSPSGQWLYVSCETNASMLAPSLAAIDLKSGRHPFLLYGLMRADGLKFAPDGSLWIGEEFPGGLIWRIADPDKLPPEQKVDRARLAATHPAIAPLEFAGRFSHEGIAFSPDGRFAWLADENPRGGLYRLNLRTRTLQWLTAGGWRSARPDDGDRLAFNRIEDMETLPDGRVLMAETGTGRILALDDRGATPRVSVYLSDARLTHPDNLAWDADRRWLWITNDDRPSSLWVWDGRNLMRVATHPRAEITGVLPVGDAVYFNLQSHDNGPELTMRLTERPAKP